MINWKIFAMMSHVNEKGRLVPIVTMTHEETVQDSDSREEAFDEFDAFCGIAKMKLAEPGMAFTATLTEYEHMEDEDGKKLAVVHIVRGYREGERTRRQARSDTKETMTTRKGLPYTHATRDIG